MLTIPDELLRDWRLYLVESGVQVLGKAFPQLVHQVLVWFRRSASVKIRHGVLFK
jgi:hypothetical protein